jgi:peptide/nickel transport system substrate-binding protein
MKGVLKMLHSFKGCFYKRLVLSFFLLVGALSYTEAKELKYAAGGDANSMDPHKLYEGTTVSFLENIYEALGRRNDKLHLIPALATEWKNIEPTVWQFKLRQNVKFHDGTPFTADDVIFSLKRAQSESSDFKGAVASVKEIKKIDEHTIDIITIGKDPILPDEMISCPIVSKLWCEKNKTLVPASAKSTEQNYADMHANGTGAFKLKERIPDVKTVVIKHNEWWDTERGNVETVIMTPIKSDATRVSALLSGEVDMIRNVPLQDINRLQKESKLQVHRMDGTRTIFLGMDMKSEKLGDGPNPLRDVRVRKALYQAIDSESLHKRIMRGFSEPTALMVASSVQGYDGNLNQRYPYDIQNAKKLLKEAGFEKGFALNMACPNDRYVNDEKICSAVVGMFAKMGVKVNLTTKTKSQFFADVFKKAPHLYLFGWSPTTIDAHDTLYSLVSTKKENGQGKFNIGEYSNPQFDKGVDEAHIELDAKKRSGLLSEAMKIHQQEIGHLPLHNEVVIWASQKNVKLEQRPDDYFRFYKVSIQ